MSVTIKNPIPKNGLWAALSAEDAMAIIDSMPEGSRALAVSLYMGVVNKCHEVVEEELKRAALASKD
jgi:hypothetical protein